MPDLFLNVGLAGRSAQCGTEPTRRSRPVTLIRGGGQPTPPLERRLQTGSLFSTTPFPTSALVDERFQATPSRVRPGQLPELSKGTSADA